MNAPLAHPLVTPHPTQIDRWTVTWQGQERTITRAGNMFKAEFCGDLPTAIFQRAIKSCVDDIEYQNFLRDHPAAPAPVMGGEELALLEYSDADNAAERMARARMEQVS